jgi:high-affinity iron transporter
MLGAFYGLGKNVFSKSENVWEGAFALIAVIIITIMGAGLLRLTKKREDWSKKIERLLALREQQTKHPLGQRFKIWTERYIMFYLPFITILREGLEAIVFIGGVGLGLPASAFPIPVITGILAGILVGWIIYK